MKLRYMIDYVYDAKRFEKDLDPYVPAGLWVVTPTGFDAGYLPGFEERDDEVNWLVNDWVEKDIKPCLNPGFMEYWRESRSPYRGAFGETIETSQFVSSYELIHHVLAKLTKEASK